MLSTQMEHCEHGKYVPTAHDCCVPQVVLTRARRGLIVVGDPRRGRFAAPWENSCSECAVGREDLGAWCHLGCVVEICEDSDYVRYVTEVLQWIVFASLRQSAFAASKQTKRRPTRYVFGTSKVDIQPLIWTGLEIQTKLEESYSNSGWVVHELAQTDAMSAKSLYANDYNDRDCKYKMKCVATCPSEVVHESKLAKETCNIGWSKLFELKLAYKKPSWLPMICLQRKFWCGQIALCIHCAVHTFELKAFEDLDRVHSVDIQPNPRVISTKPRTKIGMDGDGIRWHRRCAESTEFSWPTSWARSQSWTWHRLWGPTRASNELFRVRVPSPEQKDWMLCSCCRRKTFNDILRCLHCRIISCHFVSSFLGTILGATRSIHLGSEGWGWSCDTEWYPFFCESLDVDIFGHARAQIRISQAHLCLGNRDDAIGDCDQVRRVKFCQIGFLWISQYLPMYMSGAWSEP